MTDDISDILISFSERWRVQAIDASVIVLAHQEQVRKIKAIRLRLGIKCSSHGGVAVNRNLFKRDSLLVVRVNGLSYRKLCRELNRSVFPPANPTEDKLCKIIFDFIEAGVIPVTQLAFFIEERHRPPVT